MPAQSVFPQRLFAPPIDRRAMVCREQPGEALVFARPWRKALRLRRLLLFGLTAASAAVCSSLMAKILGLQGFASLKAAIIGIYAFLFGWIALNFWVNVLGFMSFLRRPDPFKIRPPGGTGLDAGVRTAVIMPVYNEDVPRIFAGLQAMEESLSATGKAEQFDFFILSDSDSAAQVGQEEEAWARLCGEVNGFGRIFYRRRRVRVHKKSGNIADFCRRWGGKYKYMVILDADSLMSGTCMVQMARVMEERPDIGILQTSPRGINQQTLSAKLQQFASHAYGPLFFEGMRFWQLDEGGFWGHNAIVRLAPFIEYCALPHLPGRAPFGGEILSHDFVEAALMRRAGWGVWMTDDLGDSYEEQPPNILKELARDRRWCKGNLQHLRLLWAPGLTFGHRMLFVNGNLFYCSSFLWFTSFVLMAAYAVADIFHRPQYFSSARSLFPAWPEQYRGLALELLVLTAFFLLVPKILSAAWVIISGRAAQFGGTWAMAAGVVLETLFSVFLAPVRMLFHSWYVLIAFLGDKLDWGKQGRQSRGVSFGRAFKSFGPAGLLALVLAFAAFELSQTLFLWLLIVLVPLAAAVPVSMFLSSPRTGQWFGRRGLFLTPAETRPPPELRRLHELLDFYRVKG